MEKHIFLTIAEKDKDGTFNFKCEHYECGQNPCPFETYMSADDDKHCIAAKFNVFKYDAVIEKVNFKCKDKVTNRDIQDILFELTYNK